MNRSGSSSLSSWVGEEQREQEGDRLEAALPAWCNKVEKGRLAVECPPEIIKHPMDQEVSWVLWLRLYDKILNAGLQVSKFSMKTVHKPKTIFY